MTHAEYENLLLLVDRKIASIDPKEAEYWRGYQGGINFYFYNAQAEIIPDHYSIAETARRNGSRDVHAYTRGYLDACKGLK